MILIYHGFEGSKVFKWCRSHANRVTVLFPAEPFFDRCIERVLKEHRMGKAVLAWGNREGLVRLRTALKERHIPAVPFEGPPARRQPVMEKAAVTMNLL